MSEYTAHVQVPDAAIGNVLHHQLVELESVTCVTLRSGGGTWLSIGLDAENDMQATMLMSMLRYTVSRETPELDMMPEGYENLEPFETAPLIITHGRTVVHSEGI